MDKRQSHLEMIQGVVNRLSQNSFLLKGWTVILVSALFALAADKARLAFIYLAYFPALAFWVLDAYFLHQEKLFRALFDKIRRTPEDEIDFSMDTSKFSDEVSSWAEVFFSPTLLLFHVPIAGSILIVASIM